MTLGASLWKASEAFYSGLTLAQHGIGAEQDFACRHALGHLFPRYVEFWRRHVCPATTRPHGTDFRASTSGIVCRIAQANYSVLSKLLDAADSLAKVQAGDLGVRYRNWRDAIEAAGNALQLTTELQFAVCGKNPHAPSPTSLAGQLGLTIDPFPDWNLHWKADRDLASGYRNYLVHQGLIYTVNNEATGGVLVLGRTGFAAGVTWKQAEASYSTNPGHWQRLETVCNEIFKDTVAFIDLTYERLLGKIDGLLTNPAYQRLWGWDNSTPPATMPAPSATPMAIRGTVTAQACSATMKVAGPQLPKTTISSGPCMP